MHRSVLAALLVVIPTIASAATPTTTLGPFVRTEDVGGVKVNIPLRFELAKESSSAEAALSVRVVADLGDLTAKIGAIIDEIPVPTNNCRSFSPNNPVVSLSRKALSFQGGQAVLSISGNVTMWECLENPVPKTKVEMQMKKVLGVKTKVPVVVNMGPGDPLKTKLGSQSFDVDLPLSLVKDGDRSVRMQLGRPDIELTGKYVFITKGVLSIAGVDINEKAGAALQKAVDPDALRLAVPVFDGFDPTVESARFIDDHGHLAAEVTVKATLSPVILLQLYPRLIDLIKAKR